jgi:tetratricopeptide (TPR) repeat protein
MKIRTCLLAAAKCRYLARALYERGDYGQALEAIRKAIELNGEMKNARSLLEMEDKIRIFLF